MGMFDSLWTSCPRCHQPVEWQTKAGPCRMDNYGAHPEPHERTVPSWLLGAIDGERTKCPGCKAELVFHLGLGVNVITPDYDYPGIYPS